MSQRLAAEFVGAHSSAGPAGASTESKAGGLLHVIVNQDRWSTCGIDADRLMTIDEPAFQPLAVFCPACTVGREVLAAASRAISFKPRSTTMEEQ